ncbi:unnamed protein product [Vitrella brassicaformis CCMP3155]|uniref:Uncharacterized protein n=1 Tax=Vitrella brassicaformis (strain CCMP3155) TaxID=1169540 RepID=A0A0G4EQB5_VITBC|nr:unnamed protein product [Vitrella brassicaformis CCMP3155]|eukprot:CEL99619.1 unnamed protein product [Vitrella brassicaformis CCMP3155]
MKLSAADAGISLYCCFKRILRDGPLSKTLKGTTGCLVDRLLVFCRAPSRDPTLWDITRRPLPFRHLLRMIATIVLATTSRHASKCPTVGAAIVW